MTYKASGSPRRTVTRERRLTFLLGRTRIEFRGRFMFVVYINEATWMSAMRLANAFSVDGHVLLVVVEVKSLCGVWSA